MNKEYWKKYKWHPQHNPDLVESVKMRVKASERNAIAERLVLAKETKLAETIRKREEKYTAQKSERQIASDARFEAWKSEKEARDAKRKERRETRKARKAQRKAETYRLSREALGKKPRIPAKESEKNLAIYADYKKTGNQTRTAENFRVSKQMINHIVIMFEGKLAKRRYPKKINRK